MIRSIALTLLVLTAACDATPQGNEAQPAIVANIVDADRSTPSEAPANAAIASPAEPAGIANPQPATIPASVQGRWTGASDRCDDRAAPLELAVAPDRLVFHESVGTVRSVRIGEDGRIAIDASFTGEGQSWRRTLTLTRTGDRLVIAGDGAATTRKRC